MRLLLGPLVEGPSCRLPMTWYGTALSTVTWYICAMGSCWRYQVLPRLREIATPPSPATIWRSPSCGSIHMSWWSHTGPCRNGAAVEVTPPSRVVLYAAARK